MSGNVTYFVLSGPFVTTAADGGDGYPNVEAAAGLYSVAGVVSGAEITSNSPDGLLHAGLSTITGSDGAERTIVRGAWLSTWDGPAASPGFGGGNIIDPVFDGVVTPWELGHVTLFMLDDGSIILVEKVYSSIDWTDPLWASHPFAEAFGAPESFGQAPEAFQISADSSMLHAFDAWADDYSGSFTNPAPVCFTSGARIATPRGPMPVEAIRPGDRVLTRDRGYRPVRWAGQSRLSGRRLALAERLRPIRIAAGALGPGMPARDLTVSPQHRMLLVWPEVQRLFGTTEALAAAKHLVGLPGITVDLPAEGVTYVHLLLDTHEVLLAEGAWAESLYTGPQAMKMLPAAQRTEILTLFPELAHGTRAHAAPARRLLTGREVRALHHARGSADCSPVRP